MKLRCGDIVRLRDGYQDVYMLCQVGQAKHTLINIYNGNRYTDDYWDKEPTLGDLENRMGEKLEYVGRFSS